MAFTNPTPYFGLPGYIGTDKPTFLGDFNTAFSTIDTSMQDNKLTAEGAQSAAAAASAKADSAVDKSDANAQNLVILDNRLATQITRIDGIIAAQTFNRYQFQPVTPHSVISFVSILRNMAFFDIDALISGGAGSTEDVITIGTYPQNIFKLPPSVSKTQITLGTQWGRLTNGSMIPISTKIQWDGVNTNLSAQRLDGEVWTTNASIYGETTHLFTTLP